MRKLCERPGCGAPVDVSYGIDKGNLVVWIDRLEVGDREITGKLCRRHAQSLTVPRGWTIDDRRVEVPELFVARTEDVSSDEKKPKVKSATSKSSAGRPVNRRGAIHDNQASLFDSIAEELAAADQVASVSPLDHARVEADTEDEAAHDDVVENVPPTGDATAWTPRLTRAELDDAEKPVMGRLLGRAFGERPRSAVPHSFDPDAPDADVVEPDSSGSISAIDLRGDDE